MDYKQMLKVMAICGLFGGAYAFLNSLETKILARKQEAELRDICMDIGRELGYFD